MSGRWQVALLLAALFGGYAVIGMVDADEAVRDAQMRACTPKNAEQCAAARKQKGVENVRRPRIFRA